MKLLVLPRKCVGKDQTTLGISEAGPAVRLAKSVVLGWQPWKAGYKRTGLEKESTYV